MLIIDKYAADNYNIESQLCTTLQSIALKDLEIQVDPLRF